MTKFATYAEYPANSLIAAEKALLTAWPGLNRYHDDLVLVGGLAVKYLTKPVVGLLRGAVTMDVDLGISLAADGGMYGSIADDLRGQGFTRNGQGRYVREIERLTIYIDLLTEKPSLGRGVTQVDGVPVEAFPGIQRALTTRTLKLVKGEDAFGVPKEIQVPVSGIGPLLVLKINAFSVREQPKDAYDVLLSVSNYTDGFEEAVAAFRAEAHAGNTGYAQAEAALRKHFAADGQSAPLRCASFALGENLDSEDAEDRQKQIIQQMISVGKALLGD
jgi:hypothetical protein